MKRWLDSTAATMALTVVVAMGLGVGLEKITQLGIRYLGVAPPAIADSAEDVFFQFLPGRIASVVDVANNMPEASRPALVRAADRLHFSVALHNDLLLRAPIQFNPAVDLLRQRIAAALTIQRPVVIIHRPVFVSRIDSQTPVFRHGLVVEIELQDNLFISFAIDIDISPTMSAGDGNFSRTSFVVWLLIWLILSIALSILATKRVVRPLRQLAVGVKRLGGAGGAPTIPICGPLEVKETIQSFNPTQEKLRKFNEDRTRMIAAMSHDLRTPLTRLRLRLELIEDLGQQQKLLTELDRMTGVVESILIFAQDDSNQEKRLLVDLLSRR